MDCDVFMWNGPRTDLEAYDGYVLPGGFSYGDALGAGRLWASDLRWLFQDELARFIESLPGIVSGSGPMAEVLSTVSRVARSKVPVAPEVVFHRDEMILCWLISITG